MLARAFGASVLAILLSVAATAGKAQAQQSSIDEAFEAYVDSTCRALRTRLEAGGSTTSQQDDLFLRCNGALNADTSLGETSRNDILSQYIGRQNVTPQSDGLNRTNRADQFVAARMGVIANQMRGGQFAALAPQRPILLASNDPSAASFSSGSSGLSRAGRWDGFASLGAFETEQDTTTEELGYDLDGFWIAGGVDYSFSDTLIAGVAISYVDTSADIDSFAGLDDAGETSSENLSVSAYGSWLLGQSWEVNALASFGQADFEMRREIEIVDGNDGGVNAGPATIVRTATSSTEAETLQLSLGTSYAYFFDNGVSVTPAGNITYYKSEIDGFTETGANGLDLEFDAQNFESTQLSAGVTLARAFNQDWGVVMPYASATAFVELEDDTRTVTGRYVAALSQNESFVIRSNPTDESMFELALGATARFSLNLSGFAEIATIEGLDNIEHRSISAGLRYQF